MKWSVSWKIRPRKRLETIDITTSGHLNAIIDTVECNIPYARKRESSLDYFTMNAETFRELEAAEFAAKFEKELEANENKKAILMGPPVIVAFAVEALVKQRGPAWTSAPPRIPCRKRALQCV